MTTEHGHKWKVCDPKSDLCHEGRCMICNLSLCEVCGGFEGQLLPDCPGRQLTPDEHERNYRHYLAGTGPFRNVATDTRK